MSTINDPTSATRPDTCRVKHMSLDWHVDFDESKINAIVVLSAHCADEGCSELILDVRDLKIDCVWDFETNIPLDHSTTHREFRPFGSKLTITFSKSTGLKKIAIAYSTPPNCSALQWLTPEQTMGKVQPYLFSQCEAIHARSLVPCQDSPGIKMTYSAQVRVKQGLVVVMSALSSGTPPEVDPNHWGHVIHKFSQTVPVPSYLIAIVVGALVSKRIGPRSSVWCEAQMVDAAAYEFGEVEDMLQAAEELLGPYVWGVYDILVLPPSFPYGGMENPCLTFVTPTLLAGDRSLVDVIVHEISHSWTGNLVTNATFEHFWLNEGLTSFVERKLSSRNKGESYRHFLAISGWKSLEYAVNKLGHDHPFTKLVIDLTAVDPDDALSTVAYEKGHTFLFYLERLIGGPERFNLFIRSFIEAFKYRTITSDQFKQFFLDYFSNLEPLGKLGSIDWETWFYGPGLPDQPSFDDTLVRKCNTFVDRWVVADESKLTEFSKDDLVQFSPLEVKHVLTTLNQKDAIPLVKIMRLQECYDFNGSTNSEIRFQWIRLCLKARYDGILPLAFQFITDVGRKKFVVPIYSDLFEWERVRQQAIDLFKKNRPSMNSITAVSVAKELKLE